MRVPSATPAKPLVPRPAVVAATAPAAARPTGDVRAVAASAPAAPVPKGITVDVDGRVDAEGALAATGTITLDRGFMERLVRHVTRKPAFAHRDVRFDAATNSYKGSVTVKVKGIALKLVGEAVPVADGGLPAFKFQDLGLKLGPFMLRGAWVRQLAAKLIAKEISNGGIVATPAKGAVVRLDPTTLLYDAEVLPYSMRFDTNRTKFGVQMAPNGDVRIKLNSDVPAKAPGAPLGPTSRLDVKVDEQAVLKLLRPVLGQDYQVRKVTLTDGGIKLDGQVEVKPASDVVNVVKGIIAAVAASRGGAVGNPSAEKVMMDLGLDAKLQGTEILLTPSMSLAVKQLEATLAKAGLNPKREGNSLRFDVAPLLAPYGVERVQARAGVLEGAARLDINALIKAPILRGDKW